LAYSTTTSAERRGFPYLDTLDCRFSEAASFVTSRRTFIRFLHAIEREVPAGKTIHAILDNYAAHKHPAVRQWLARHPRWTFHFTPTLASWLNAVEAASTADLGRVKPTCSPSAASDLIR
jgi:DDE superfamily endonuclease